MSAVQKGHELAEQAVLGAVLLDSAALNDVLGVIDETSFCRPEHAAIWQTMVKLFQEGETIDPLVVSKHTPTVSVDYLIDLHGMLGSAQNAPAHARLVAEAAKLRSVERVLQTALKRVKQKHK